MGLMGQGDKLGRKCTSVRTGADHFFNAAGASALAKCQQLGFHRSGSPLLTIKRLESEKEWFTWKEKESQR